jgi:hypothetical protein
MGSIERCVRGRRQKLHKGGSNLCKDRLSSRAARNRGVASRFGESFRQFEERNSASGEEQLIGVLCVSHDIPNLTALKMG